MSDVLDRQREHYRHIAADYVQSRRESAAYRAFLERWASRLLAPWLERVPAADRRTQVILDPMCGAGNLTPYLLEHSEKVILNDLSPEMLEHFPRALRKRVTMLPPSDVARLPLGESAVDVVVVSGGLHHAHGRLPLVLAELRRVLKRGGLLLFGEPSDAFLPVRALRRLVYRFHRGFDHESEQGFRPLRLRQALEKAGFVEIELRPFGSVGYLLMAQSSVLPLLRRSKSPRLFEALQWCDRAVEESRLLRRSCLALTGVAVSCGAVPAV